MKKIILFLVMLLSVNIVMAETFTISVKGEPRAPNMKNDLMYSVGAYIGDRKLGGDTTLDNEKGFFEIKEITFDNSSLINGIDIKNDVVIGIDGDCIHHTFHVLRQNDQFEIFDDEKRDDMGSLDKATPFITSKESNIDLGILQEDKSNQLIIDSDDPVTMLVEDQNSVSVHENSGYSKNQGSKGALKDNSQYKVTLKSEKGKTWEKSFKTGDYCATTRIIKRGNYFQIENFENGQMKQLTFFQRMKLFFKGIFS